MDNTSRVKLSHLITLYVLTVVAVEWVCDLSHRFQGAARFFVALQHKVVLCNGEHGNGLTMVHMGRFLCSQQVSCD